MMNRSNQQWPDEYTTKIKLGMGPLGYMPPDRETDGGMSLAPKGFRAAVIRAREQEREAIDLTLHMGMELPERTLVERVIEVVDWSLLQQGRGKLCRS